MSTNTVSTRSAAIGLALGGLTLAVGGHLHPHGESGVSAEAAMAGMLNDPIWPYSHGIALIGMILVATSLAALLSGAGSRWRVAARRAGWGAAAATALAAVAHVPHLLAFTEADEALAGAPTPLLDVGHGLDVLANPLFGLGVAALAIATARSRELVNGWVLAVPAVVGGVMFAAAAPLIALTQNQQVAPLFAGLLGMGLWFLTAGLRTALATGQPVESTPQTEMA